MPKVVNRDKMRSDIAAKAIELLAKKGFQSTTIQDIADAAGLGKGTIYHYFKTKEEILLVVSGALFCEMERSLSATLAKIDKPAGELSALIEEALHVTAEVENLFIVYTELWLMNMRSHHYQEFMGVIKHLHDGLTDVVARMIEEGKKRKLWPRDTDSAALAAYLVSSFDGVIAHYMMDKENFDLPRVTREFIRFFLRQGSPRK